MYLRELLVQDTCSPGPAMPLTAPHPPQGDTSVGQPLVSLPAKECEEETPPLGCKHERGSRSTSGALEKRRALNAPCKAMKRPAFHSLLKSLLELFLF